MPAELVNHVTTRQAAELMGVDQDHVTYLLKTEKRIEGIKLGRDWLVYAPSVQQYIDTKSPKGRPPSHKPKIQKAT